MTRVKYDLTISLAGWRRLTRLALLIPPIFAFFLYHGGSSGLVLSDKDLGLFFPTAYAHSPDQTIHNNHLSRNQQNPHVVQSNDYANVGNPCYAANEKALDKRLEGTKGKNSLPRQTIEMIWSAKRSIEIKMIQRDFQFSKIFDKNPLRNLAISKKEKQTCLQKVTRLVGGANLHVDMDEDPRQQDNASSNSPSSLSPDVSQWKESILRRRLQQTLAVIHKISSQAGPSLITTLFLIYYNGKKDEISLVTLYTLALLGASCGFHLFLHFITLGYALGVTLPLIVALHFYQKQYELPLPTIYHSLITVFWGIRLFTFLAIREYATWPSLHQKVVEVQAKMKIPFASKILCWSLYSFFYVTLVASCWSRLLQSSSSSKCGWGLLGYTGLSLQFIGLLLETIADLQKNSFKTRNKLSWCNVGVWKYSTHPNYLGEGVFWWGAYLAHGFYKPVPSILATVGLMAILSVLKGSAKSLSSKQKEKYGQDVDFYQFQRTHNVFGPKRIWSRQQRVEAADPLPTTVAMTNNYDTSVSAYNDDNAQEINQL